MFFLFNDTASTEIHTYCHTLSLHDALPISGHDGPGHRAVLVERERRAVRVRRGVLPSADQLRLVRLATSGDEEQGEVDRRVRSEEHTSELQSLMRSSYAVFCLKKPNRNKS